MASVSASATAVTLGLVGLFLGAYFGTPVGDQLVGQADARRQVGEHPARPLYRSAAPLGGRLLSLRHVCHSPHDIERCGVRHDRLEQMVESANDKVRLAEFASLRREIGQRTAIQQALVALTLTVAGVVSGNVIGHNDRQGLFVVVALASDAFGLLWLDHHLNIHRIANYVKDELWLWSPSWERSIRNSSEPRWWSPVYLVAMILVFTGVAVAALSIAAGSKSGAIEVLWWIGVVLTAFTFVAFIAVFACGPGRLK